MRILVTGSSGYLGRVFCRHFLTQGAEVIGVSRSEGDVSDHPAYRFRSCDVRDKEGLQRIFTETRPTHVLHAAYLMSPRFTLEQLHEVNVVGSRNVLEVSNATPSVKQMLLVSSTSTYGARPDNPEWIPESHPLRAPEDYYYAAFKMAIEAEYQAFRRRPDLRLVIARVCWVVGPSYTRARSVMRYVARAPFLPQVGEDDYRVQCIHEADLAEAFAYLVADEELEGVFNVAPDTVATMSRIANRLDKRVVRISHRYIRPLFRVLAWVRPKFFTPAQSDYLVFPIVASPEKLVDRFDHQWSYSSEEAFFDALAIRRQRGHL
ncbi:MAG: NAD-dependent epimerase/dehydratase family protein [Gammaproteobacteria bacterium]|nr:NAD-dependent epimerase/dehydratase family protein [Gammaproteobacteria bacterium]